MQVTITVDHGNANCKTKHKIFTSGLYESTTRPTFGEDILKYGGNYYAISDTRIPYMRDKSKDNRFYILTLFAIAYELELAGIHTPDEIIEIQLLIGLPPAHIGLQGQEWEKYFVRDDIEEFTFHGKSYEIYISHADSYPQALAAVMPMYGQIATFPKAVIFDLGGFTADYLVINNGKPDTRQSGSLENGVIIFYDTMIERINAEFDVLLTESEVDAILKDEPADCDDQIKQIVKAQAQTFINDLLSKLRERMIDLRTGKAVFVGGGSILFKKQIEASERVGTAIFVENITANAVGFELLHQATIRAGQNNV